MIKARVLILGSTGFVGQSLVRVFQTDPDIELICTSRRPVEGQLYFDIEDPSSWQGILDASPDILIEASGYGVVKNQTDLNKLYSINYLKKREFLDYIVAKTTDLFWIQIGTAFEYSLEKEKLSEDSPCFPRSHYGISKSLFSSYLQSTMTSRFTILKPFGMFGEGEDATKFFPLLISAQKNKKTIPLSDGLQYRDYFYVDDLALFILKKIQEKNLSQIENQILNLGSGIPRQLRELAEILATEITEFDPALWAWGAIPQRSEENRIFYNSSQKAERLGFVQTNLREALKKTGNYYYAI